MEMYATIHAHDWDRLKSMLLASGNLMNSWCSRHWEHVLHSGSLSESDLELWKERQNRPCEQFARPAKIYMAMKI